MRENMKAIIEMRAETVNQGHQSSSCSLAPAGVFVFLSFCLLKCRALKMNYFCRNVPQEVGTPNPEHSKTKLPYAWERRISCTESSWQHICPIPATHGLLSRNYLIMFSTYVFFLITWLQFIWSYENKGKKQLNKQLRTYHVGWGGW